MSIEKKWLSVAPRLLTADGTTNGIVTTSTTSGIKVKQFIVLQSSTLPPLEVQVKRVSSPTQFTVGPKPGDPSLLQGKSGLKTVTDVSAYTVASGAFFYATEQDKSVPSIDDINKAVYEQEPTVAKRSILVDEFGNFYNAANPLPTSGSGGGGGNSGLAPANFDEVRISRDVNEYPLQYQFYLAGTSVGNIDVTYDANQFSIKYKKS